MDIFRKKKATEFVKKVQICKKSYNSGSPGYWTIR